MSSQRSEGFLIGDGTTSIIDLQGQSFGSQYRIVVQSGTLQFTATAGTATPQLTGAGIIQGEVALDGSNVLTITPTGLVVGTSHVYHYYHTNLSLAYTDVVALDGSMTITGSNFGEILTGGDFNDTIYGGSGADTLNGEAGDDKLYGRAGIDALNGGEGLYFVDNPGDEVLEIPGEGTDTVYTKVDYTLGVDEEIEVLRANAGATDLILRGNRFDNRLVGRAGDDTLSGGAGNDRLDGNDGSDTLDVGDGDDKLYGDDGADGLNGGDGNDQLYGGIGGDTLDGGAGDDKLYGNVGVDTLDGGAGNDRFDGGVGADEMTGGAGNDLFYVDNPGDEVNEAIDGGTDAVYASINCTLAAEQEIESLRANAGATGLTLGGNEFNKTVFGAAGNDRLSGGESKDKLYGRDGADTLDGGAGNDRLEGGAGADIFLFDTPFIGVTNVDTVADFELGIDTIHLDHTYFTGLALGHLSASAFAIDSPSGTAPQIVYNSANGSLSYDSNGADPGGANSFAKVTGVPALTAGSFFVV